VEAAIGGAASFAPSAKGARFWILLLKNRLERRYGQRHLHFITCSCYRRRPLLGTARKRDVFLKILDEVRTRYQFLLVGYVVMPEHIHLLISEPKIGTPSTVMQVLKQRVSQLLRRKTRRRRNPDQLGLWPDALGEASRSCWQRRFYDFNVWSRKKRVEKLRYMHMNPVKHGLVADPKLWPWSSHRFYQYGEKSVCTPDREPKQEFEARNSKPSHPFKNRRDGPPSKS
jgi:putative transposase